MGYLVIQKAKAVAMRRIETTMMAVPIATSASDVAT
jgi:hypothetical protein